MKIKKWEYKVEPAYSFASFSNPYYAEKVETQLDGYGKEGWELVQVCNEVVIFKR